jgi:hypothetical protein
MNYPCWRCKYFIHDVHLEWVVHSAIGLRQWTILVREHIQCTWRFRAHVHTLNLSPPFLI